MRFVKASLYLGIALVVSACSEQVTVETRLDNAKSYLSQNKVNESIIELKNAIRADNKNAESRFLLGLIYLDLGDGAAAVKELEHANELKYDANRVIPLLARAYIITNSDDDVLALNEATQDLAAEEKNQYLAYRTLAALRSEQLEQAQQSVELAKSISEKSLYTLLASAYLKLSENNYDEAKALITKILTIDAKQVDTLLLQGQMSMATNEFKQAATSFTSYLNLQPRSGIVQLQLANALLKSEQFEEAEKYADVILAKVKAQPFAHYIKAMVAFNAKDFEKASEHASMALSANFNPFNLTLVAGASAFYLKNWQQSRHYLSTVVKYLPKTHQARRMLAVTQLELGLVGEISATAGGFELNNQDDSEFMASLSYKLLELGATDEAKELLAQSENTISNDARGNARQGILKLMMNDPSGMQNLQDAVKLDPELIEAELALGYAALQNNDLKKAKEIANKWQQKYPSKAGGHNLMASIAIKEKNYEQAEQLFEQSLAVEPDNVFTLTEQLRLARQQQDIPLSKQRAENLITIAPNDNEVLRQYFGVYQNEMALKKLQEASDQDKSDINKTILLAEAMVSLTQYKKAESLLTKQLETPKLPKKYWIILTFIHKKQDDNEKLQATLEQWIKASPYHIEPVLLLTDSYASRGDNNQALTAVNNGLKYHKEHLILQMVQMQLLLNSKETLQAKSLYKKLAFTSINDALKDGMLGRISLLEEDYEQAIPKLNTLYKVYPTNQNAIHLAGAYLGNKDKANAAETLEHYLTIDPDDGRIKTMLAGVYLENDTNKAIASYEDILTKQPKNIIAHNNLAWLYLENNKLDNALIHAERAFELAPHIANIVDTYSQVLLASGDNSAALKHANKAVELTEGKNIDMQLNYVEALIANSRSNEAKELLSKLGTITDKQTTKKAELLTTL